MRRTLVLIACLAAGGCGTIPAPYNPRPVTLKSYEMGQEQTATVGDPIFRVQTAVERPVFVTNYEYKPSTLRAIPEGSRFATVAHFPAEGLLVVADTSYNRAYSIVVDTAGTPRFWYSAGQRSPFAPLDRPLFRRGTTTGDQPGSFTGEIIYSGVTGNTLRATYREYVDNLARPAFAQELQYDLSQSKEITFRSVRIEVLEATNSGIRYRVVTDGDLPWVRR